MEWQKMERRAKREGEEVKSPGYKVARGVGEKWGPYARGGLRQVSAHFLSRGPKIFELGEKGHKEYLKHGYDHPRKNG